jgi:hypothetical protein
MLGLKPPLPSVLTFSASCSVVPQMQQNMRALAPAGMLDRNYNLFINSLANQPCQEPFFNSFEYLVKMWQKLFKFLPII